MKLALAAAVAVSLFAVSPALADDVILSHTFDSAGPGGAYSANHDPDEDPYKGYLTVTWTNNTTESLGAFHFQIFSIGYSVANVDFVVTTPYEPTSPDVTFDSPVGWAVDNTPVTGSTLDLFFYGDPVAPNATVTFTVYTDNTVDKKPFGVMMYPVVVPEPMTMGLAGLGLAGLLISRRRRAA